MKEMLVIRFRRAAVLALPAGEGGGQGRAQDRFFQVLRVARCSVALVGEWLPRSILSISLSAGGETGHPMPDLLPRFYCKQSSAFLTLSMPRPS